MTVMRLARGVAVSALAVLPTAAVGAATELALFTGPEGGAYYQLGQDLKRVARAGGITVSVQPSKGSVDNISAISRRPGLSLGIVQSDVLTFVAEQRSNPDLARIAENVRMVFPLHDEAVHLVGRRDLGGLDQLAGRRIAIGREGSGTYLTARRVLKLADVVPAEMLPIEGAEALAQLKAGRIDAMFYVVGAPVALLRTVTAEDGLALLGITHKSVVEAYEPVEIAANTYGFQPAPVSTVAVKALLVAHDPQRRECDSLGRFARQVAASLDTLVKQGHPKWKQIDLAAPVKGWEQYDCVRTHVSSPPADGSPAASAAERNPVADAIKGVLDKN